MGIEENHRRLRAHFLDRDLERLKRILQDWLHERPGLDVDYSHWPFRGFEHDRAAAGCAGPIIHRAQSAGFRVDEGDDFLLVPDMVASRYHGDAGAQKINGYFWCNSPAARGVL